MDLKGVAAFVAAAETLSVTAAARRLGYAQSTLTVQVKNLERDLKTTLFDRTSTGLRLSAAGTAFLPHARAVLAAVDEARLSVGSAGVSGSLVLGSMESLMTSRLLPLFEYLSNRHPDLRVQLRPNLNSDSATAVARGDLDAAFVIDDRTEIPGVHVEMMRVEPLVLVAAPEHALAGSGSITVDDIRRSRIVGTEQGCTYRDRFEALLKRSSDDRFPIVELGAIDAVREAVGTMNAVAVLPRITVADHLASGRLVELDWEVPFTVHTLLLHPDTRRVSPKVSALVEAARKVIAETP